MFPGGERELGSDSEGWLVPSLGGSWIDGVEVEGAGAGEVENGLVVEEEDEKGFAGAFPFTPVENGFEKGFAGAAELSASFTPKREPPI